MKKQTFSRTKQGGFTIVELMVAATLGVLILAGAISMLSTNKRVYTEQDEMGRLQENARFALDLLVRDIRMAGYAGCADDAAEVVNHVNGYDDATDIHYFIAVEGSENAANWLPGNSTDEVANMIPNSDGITVRYLAPTGIFVVSPYMTTASAAIHVTTDSGLEKGDIISITDCSSADIVVITSNPSDPPCSSESDLTCKSSFNHNSGTVTGAEPGNWLKDLSKTYTGDAGILKFYAARYYVGNDANGSPVLRRMTGVDKDTGAPVVSDLVEGVENLQVLYGEDTAGSDMIADTYVNAAGVTDWDNVVSVRIALLMRTVDEYGPDVNDNTYDLLGETINPVDDRRRRRVFTATIQIRNRSS
ncbi:MAG: PilW family protein [Proteobacteria bacterium]|nr:PilW family protein [Pseudomonadota bacterium]